MVVVVVVFTLCHMAMCVLNEVIWSVYSMLESHPAAILWPGGAIHKKVRVVVLDGSGGTDICSVYEPGEFERASGSGLFRVMALLGCVFWDYLVVAKIAIKQGCLANVVWLAQFGQGAGG